MSRKRSSKGRPDKRTKSVRGAGCGKSPAAKAQHKHTAVQSVPSIVRLVGPPALLAVAVFANTLANEPVYDDAYRIQEFADELPATGDILLQPRGLSHLTQVLDQRLWGSWIPGFHLTNVLLHAIATCLATYCALLLSRSRRLAMICGSLFAVHPVHVEAVASFVNRNDILAMIFISLGLIFWRRSSQPVSSYLLTVACYALGMFSKEVAVVGLAPMLFLSDVILPADPNASRRQQLRRAVIRFLPLLLLGISATILIAGRMSRYFAPKRIHLLSEQRLDDYPQVLANVAAAVPEYFRLLFFPLKLSADYPLWPEMTVRSTPALFGIALATAWLLISLLLVRRSPLVSFAMLWTAVMYLPCSNVIPLSRFWVAERYLYAPSFGVCLLLAWAADRCLAELPGSRHGLARAAVIALTILAIALAGLRSIDRNRDWRDHHSLWTSALDAGYGTARIHHALGITYSHRGDAERSLEHFKKAQELRPGYSALFLSNLVSALANHGRLESAAKVCDALLEQLPADAKCLHVMARVGLQRGDRPAAIGYLVKILAIAEPADVLHLSALQQLALLRATAPEPELRDARRAVELAERARQLTGNSDPKTLWTLAAVYRATGERSQAIEWGQRSYELARLQGLNEMTVKIAVFLESLGERPSEIP